MVRSDYGKETTMVCDIYRQLAFKKTGAPLYKCFKWGKSIKNVKIESFWTRLGQSYIKEWRTYF